MNVPDIKLHAASGRWRAWIGGRYVYFGKDQAIALRRYEIAIGDWLKAGRPGTTGVVTVAEMMARVLEWAKDRYEISIDQYSSEHINWRCALNHLDTTVTIWLPESGRQSVYIPRLPANEFAPPHLVAVQEQMIAARKARSYINACTRRIQAAFGRARLMGIIDRETIEDIERVPAIPKGHARARETAPKQPAPEAHIDAVLERVSEKMAAIIRVQIITGLRINETLQMRVGNLDTSGELWRFNLGVRHKTGKKRHEKRPFIGPDAQDVIRPWLERARSLHSMAAPVWPSQYDPMKPVYSRSVRHEIIKACNKAKIPEWTTHQLRHNKGTDVFEAEALKAVKAALGHRSSSSSRVYAEQEALERELARLYG